ncbi:2-polyprenyl-6-methoxyphenol hydroxylase-like FAD-dependent oxidoreductase [Luteibacter sp. HA06]|jgi:salicylate hydroxylase
MKVIIAGAGIVGLTTAIALRAKGAEVVVLEKASEVRAAGAAIGLWPNAIEAFEEIGLGDTVRGLGVTVDTWFFTPSGHRLRAEGHGDEDHRFILVPRPALNDRLADALGTDRIKLNARLTSFTETVEGVQVQLENGETLQADLLIGADGVYSEVRRHLLPGFDAQHHQGHHAWRGLLPSGIEPTESSVLTVGRDGTRGGYARIANGQVMWMVNQFDSAEPSSDKKAEAVMRAGLLQGVGGDNALVRLIEATPESAILHNPIMFVPELPSWTSARVALIGDAAHGLSPHIAAGGTLGVEDVRVLTRALTSGRSLSQALTAYERNRMPHYGAVMTHSRRVEQARTAVSYAEAYAKFSHWMLNAGAATARDFQ